MSEKFTLTMETAQKVNEWITKLGIQKIPKLYKKRREFLMRPF
jgi:hypothetical protein